jgi:hypothetical protein
MDIEEHLNNEINLIKTKLSRTCCFSRGLKILLDEVLRNYFSITACAPIDNLFYPYSRNIRCSRLAHIMDIFNETLQYNHIFAIQNQTFFQNIKDNPTIKVAEVTKFLVDNFSIYESLPICSCDKFKTVQIEIRKLNELRTINSVSRRLEFLEEDIYTLQIHGSYSIGDAIKGYSDFDATGWIKKNVFSTEEKLAQCRKRILTFSPAVYFLDYTQHHEITWLSEHDLLCRNQSLHINSLFNESRLLLGKSLFEINAEELNSLDSYYHFLMLSRRIFRFNKDLLKSNWYAFKEYLSMLSLIPALFYQSKGIKINKKSAIKMLVSEYPELTKPLILTTTIRNMKHDNLKPGNIYQFLVSFQPNLVRFLYSMRIKTPSQVLKMTPNDFFSSSNKLIANLTLELTSLGKSNGC